MENLHDYSKLEDELSAEDLRKFVHEFILSWHHVRLGPTEGGEDDLIELIGAIRKDAATKNALVKGLASITAEENRENPVYVLSLLDILACVQDTDASDTVLALLNDTDSPLWQAQSYLVYLGFITKDMPTDQLVDKVHHIAQQVFDSGLTDNACLAYSSHLSRLADLLFLAGNHDHDEDVLDEAIDRINILRYGLRPAVLLEAADRKNDTSKTLADHAEQAHREIEAIFEEKEYGENLVPLFHLTGTPELYSGQLTDTPELDYLQMIRRHDLTRLETNPHPATPTIGIEIEIRKNTLLREEHLGLTEEQKSSLFMSLKNRYENTAYAGIPADDHDTLPFHEFAFKPRNYYLTLSREVQLLDNRGYIPESLRPPVMHVTLGGIHAKLDERQENGAFILSRIIEATNWSSSHHRLLRKYPAHLATPSSDRTTIGWDCKGLAGVLDKKHDLFLNDPTSTEMVEFRTCQFKGVAAMNRTLASFQSLGAALGAAQRQATPMNSMASEQVGHEDEVALANIWYCFESKVQRLFEQYNLENPKRPYTPLQPENDTAGRYVAALGEAVLDSESGFYRFGELLKQASEHKGSDGDEFVNEARRIVIQTCKEITPIIYGR